MDEIRLVDDLRSQLATGVARSDGDPFAAGAVYDDFDAAAHTFGLLATARLYQDLTGQANFDAFATRQRDWVLGANPWGASLMIGVGTDFPHCPQHVVANLSGQPGRHGADPPWRCRQRPEQRRPVRRRPRRVLRGGACLPAGWRRRLRGGSPATGASTSTTSRSWQTVEPAIDFTAVALLAFALLQ